MRLVIQRVNFASVRVEDVIEGQIGKGYVVFLGIGEGDSQEMAAKYVEKLSKLRIFQDEGGKTNLSLSDVSGDVLVISQFTLYADCKKGNRPSFVGAGSPLLAEELYEYFLEQCRVKIGNVKSGKFGADMKVLLENDGPFTLVWDSRDW